LEQQDFSSLARKNMDGIHDLGGLHGFGAVRIKEEDYVFARDWQRRSFALAQALASTTPFCADLHRQEIERLDATDYLAMDYFDKWAAATSSLLLKAGLVNEVELQTGLKLFDVDLQKHQCVSAETLVKAMKQGVKLDFPHDKKQAKFLKGQSVRVLNMCQKGHTRAPRYLRGAVGTIIENAGVFQFADAVATGRGQDPQHCYNVAFAASALWAADAELNHTIYADLWESYLEAA
jgi:nitrile hydratase subunit beta